MKKSLPKIKTIIASISVLAMSLLYSSKTFAYDGAIIDTNKDGKEGIIQVLSMVADILAGVVGVLAVLGIAISGVQYLTASGNEEQLRKSKRRIFEIVIGVGAYFVIYGLLKWLLPGFNGINIK